MRSSYAGMAEPRPPAPAGAFVALLYSDRSAAESALDRLRQSIGPLNPIGPSLPFRWTKYYSREMGENLQKQFFVSEWLIERDLLLPVKKLSLEIERDLADERKRRRVNIDPGLLAPENLVLASTKPRGHRVYLGEGIWAEVTLIFEQGEFSRLPWTYPDYGDPMVLEMLDKARKTLLLRLRSGDYHTLRELKC